MYEEYSSYLICLANKVDINYGKLTLCNLNNYNVRQFSKRQYQIHCDDARIKHFELFDKPEKAVSKFMELKAQISSMVRNKRNGPTKPQKVRKMSS